MFNKLIYQFFYYRIVIQSKYELVFDTTLLKWLKQINKSCLNKEQKKTIRKQLTQINYNNIVFSSEQNKLKLFQWFIQIFPNQQFFNQLNSHNNLILSKSIKNFDAEEKRKKTSCSLNNMLNLIAQKGGYYYNNHNETLYVSKERHVAECFILKVLKDAWEKNFEYFIDEFKDDLYSITYLYLNYFQSHYFRKRQASPVLKVLFDDNNESIFDNQCLIKEKNIVYIEKMALSCQENNHRTKQTKLL